MCISFASRASLIWNLNLKQSYFSFLDCYLRWSWSQTNRGVRERERAAADGKNHYEWPDRYDWHTIAHFNFIFIFIWNAIPTRFFPSLSFSVCLSFDVTRPVENDWNNTSHIPFTRSLLILDSVRMSVCEHWTLLHHHSHHHIQPYVFESRQMM